TPDPSRLAVLYLDAPAGDERLSHVGRGIARDLIDALSDVPALTVISDLEVRHVTSPAMNVDSIVRALGVGTIVHGSLEPQGDSLRVLLRVSDASGTLRAAIPLLVQQGQVAGLHDEIASRVASALRRLVGAGVAARTWRAATRSDSAWLLRQRAAERYQAGRDALISGAARTGMLMIEQADTMLALAAALDRAWSDPIVARGWIAAHRAVGQDSATQARWLTAGIQFADEALTRSPGSAPARELRGVQRYRLWRHVRHGRDAPLLALALADLRAATLADPRRARAWTTMGQILNDRGDAQGAAAAARAAMDADPYLVDVAPSVQLLVFSHLQAQRYDSARTLCLDGVRRFPSAPELRACELSVLGWAGRGRADATRAWTLLAREEAALGGPEGPALFPAGRAFAAAVLARSGLTDSAHAVLGATRARLGRDSVGPRWLVYEAMVRTALGERAPALTLLERAVASDVGLRPSIASLPWFVTLRGERRFIALTEPSFSP
ncbi:MAG TPA: hypothetical protein VEA99_14590, partial [Gemmatimonadaceae bacterium]|nr:hypothetical protein [Gemmatimonadaceae bacterium]